MLGVGSGVHTECTTCTVFGKCMVIDVVFSSQRKRCHQNCWAGALVANLLAALGVARLRFV